MPGSNKKVTHISKPAAEVYMTFLLPPVIKGFELVVWLASDSLISLCHGHDSD